MILFELLKICTSRINRSLVLCNFFNRCTNSMCSSANAKKWEIELQTLKNNNVRLTTALQESTANVEEWKKQLAMYKEESARMKKRVRYCKVLLSVQKRRIQPCYIVWQYSPCKSRGTRRTKIVWKCEHYDASHISDHDDTLQVMELEKGGVGDIIGNHNLQQRVNELTDKMHALERDNQTKQEVCYIFLSHNFL